MTRPMARRFVTDTIGLDPGHYKLYWQGRNDKNVKHKTFWVDGDCEAPPRGAQGVGTFLPATDPLTNR